MPETTFAGVSPRSLGDLLKGYALIAAIGEQIPNARFWWDEGFHLVAGLPVDLDQTHAIEEALRSLPGWAESVATAFGRTVKKSCDNRLPCPDLAKHLSQDPRFRQKKNKKRCLTSSDPLVLTVYPKVVFAHQVESHKLACSFANDQ